MRARRWPWAAPAPAGRGRGFSLLELLVAIAIVLVLLGAVGLSVTVPERADARLEAERARALVALARDAAVLEARPLRLVAAGGGYRFEALEGGAWQGLRDETLRPRRLPAGVRAALRAGAGGKGAAAVLVFEETGLYTPFEWRFRDAGAAAAWAVRGDGVGEPVVVRAAAREEAAWEGAKASR